jgi:DNA-binding CsgD family transcriptional regulator
MTPTDLPDLFAAYRRQLARQQFDVEALDYRRFEAHRANLEVLGMLQESSVSVFDLFQQRHIYLSKHFEQVLGYNLDDANAQGNDYFDSRVHASDLAHSLLSGTYFLDMALAMPPHDRLKYKLVHEYRMRHAEGHYVRVIEQFKGLELDDRGNIWLALCVLDISPDQDEVAGFRARLVDTRTGRLYEGPVAPSPSTPLSNREQEVLRLLAQGHISKQIADKLYISVHTVNTHRQRIIEKLQASNTAEAVNYAYSMGLIA